MPEGGGKTLRSKKKIERAKATHALLRENKKIHGAENSDPLKTE